MQGSSSVWDDHRPEKGPSVDACAEVENSAGKEDEIMDFLRENADNGLWVPRFNDCHNAAQDAVESQGLVYPGAPGGRLGRFSGIGGGW